MELFPMMVTMGIWDPFIKLGGAIMQPLYWVVSGILVLFHSAFAPLFGTNSGWTWALSIMSLTVVIRVALIPLFVKQIKSSRSMQMLQPKVRELQKKYGHDREKLGQETMKLYKENNANPLASCLPLLLQSPIFIALFRVLDGAARNIPRGKWLEDRPDLLSSLNGATIFNAKISDTFMKVGFANGINSVHIVTLVLIVAMTVTLFVTQLQLMRKNMPAEALTGPFAQQQKVMLYAFPLMFAVFGVNFPVGVLIYWFTSNLWTMGQQFYVIRRNPAPGTPAYDAWEARRKAHGKPPMDPPVAERGAPAGAHGPAGSNGRSTPTRTRRTATNGTAANVDGTHGTGANGKKPTVNGATPVSEPLADAPIRVVRQQPRNKPRSQRRR